MSRHFREISVAFAMLLLTGCESQPTDSTSSAPAGGRKSLGKTIQEEAGKVADVARQGAANVAESAKEVAHVAKDEALQIAATARELARSTKEQAVAVAQQKFDEARTQLAVLQEQKERVQESLRPEYERAMAELSERVDRLKTRVSELREAAPEAWQTTVQELAPLVSDVRQRFDSAWDQYVQGGHVQGSVSYLERVLVPENAEMRIRLLDVSRSDSDPGLIAQQSISLQGAPPFSFDLRFDPAKVSRKGAYAVEAEIQFDGKRQFATAEPKHVTIEGSATKVELLVKRVE